MAFLAQKLISASGATEETDDDFNLVTGLYHFDGSNGAQNNTFTGVGASGASQSWTRNGSPTQGSFSPFSTEEGKWSVEFDGSNAQNRLAIGSTSDFAFGTGDYTLEAWVFPNSLANSLTQGNYIVDFRSSGNESYGTGGLYMYIGVNGSGDQVLVPYSGNAVAGITLGEWNHVAVTRESGTERTFINGVLKGSNSNTSNHSSNAIASIGCRYEQTIGTSHWATLDGFLSNFRVIKGSALYTSSFTVPTEPLTAVTNTKLLTSCSNRFRDKSTSAHSLTVDGTVKVKPFSPFAPSAEYDASTMGGSGYFVRTNNDSISLTDSSLAIGSGDFTIEGWYYFDGDNSSSVGLFQQDNGVKGPAIGWWPANSNGWQLYYGSSYVGTTESGIRMFEWIHVAFVRSSGTIKVYVNGVNSANVSDTTNYTSTNFKIGQYYSTGYGMEGYISNFKMCLNAIYTSAFTPPTALVTPTSGGSSAASTKILVNFTDAAIIDSSRKTNVSTVGNAQLDTSVKKFGTASAEFDETGDYLTIPPSTFVPLGSGDFTIECFAYFLAVATNGQGLFQLSNGTLNTQDGRGPAIGTYGGTGKWHIYYGAGENQTNTVGNAVAAPSQNTWYHVAFVRTSGVIKIFIDGTQIGSNISYTGNYTDNVFTIGGWYSSDYLLNGYIDEFRISLKARYTSNFTAPTKAFPNL